MASVTSIGSWSKGVAQLMRTFVSRSGTIIGVIFLFSILDTFVSGHLESKNTFRALRGTKQLVTGKLQRPVESIIEITYSSDNPAIHLVFLECKGRIWRGRLEVYSGAAEGEYSLTVFPKRTLPDKDTPVYKVRIFRDNDRYRESFQSFSRRYFGVAPWWISIGTLPLVLLCLALSHYFSGKTEALLVKHGIGPIYKLVRRKNEWEITFGLGENHGVSLGDRLLLLDDKMESAGEVVVTAVGAEESQASLDLSQKIAPTYLIALIAKK